MDAGLVEAEFVDPNEESAEEKRPERVADARIERNVEEFPSTVLTGWRRKGEEVGGRRRRGKEEEEGGGGEEEGGGRRRKEYERKQGLMIRTYAT